MDILKLCHGGDVYRNTVRLDFSINTNPLGMPKEVSWAAIKGIEVSGHYPDYYCSELKNKLVEYASREYGKVSPDDIVFGNGSTELIYRLCDVVSGKRGAVSAPIFTEYERALEAARFEVSTKLDTSADLLFICNPNNPTGEFISKERLTEILEECKKNGCILAVDECFIPLTVREDESMMGLVGEYDNLVIIRAFTKTFAMPGLRLGYIVTSNDMIKSRIARILPPWNISISAQMGGVAALNMGRDYVLKAKKLIKKEREYLVSELENGIADKIYPSETNFILFTSEDNLYDKLLAQGILIRKCGDFTGLTDRHYRIAVRKHEENLELIKAIRSA